MVKKFRKVTSILLAFIMTVTFFAANATASFAATNDITVSHFDFIQTNDKGNTSVRIVIEGTGFRQIFGVNTKPESVITDVLVRSGAEPKSLLQGQAVKAGVKAEVTDSLITIVAPKTGEFSRLNVNTNANNTITIVTKETPTKYYKFDAKINKLPSMPGSLNNKKIYVGEGIDITGDNFDGLDDVVVAGASHQPPLELNILDSEHIRIPSLKKNTLNKPESIQFIKIDNESNSSNPRTVVESGVTTKYLKPDIKFTAEYTDKVLVFEKLPGMENLRVLPNEGPNAVPSKITVQALDKSDQIMYDIFKKNYRIVLRRETKDANGEIQEHEIKLTDVKVVHEIKDDESTPIVAIEGWTPAGVHPPNTKWDVVIQDPDNASSEGIARQAYTFVTSNPSPQITGISPSEGPDTGGTDVLITGKNFLKVNTPGIRIPNGVKITPKNPAGTIGTDVMTIDYNVPSGIRYGDQEIAAISRNIEVRIASKTNANAGNINQLPSPPKPGDKLPDGTEYGKFHFMAESTDGAVFTTTNAATTGPQEVLMEILTTLTFHDGTTIIIPEAAKYSPFIYTEKNPTPVVDKAELAYGFFNDSKEEEEPPSGGNDGVKPLMLRITGQKFEAIKDGENMIYPRVQFVLPDNTVLPAISSEAKGDTKVLDENGNPIDGIYKKVGTTLVISIIPPVSDKYGLRQLIMNQQEQPGNFKNLDAIIQVTNPSGNSNTAAADGAKFQFRRATESSWTDVHSKQPVITGVLRGATPVKKLPSDADTDITVRFKAVAGISDLAKVKMAVDGLDITDKIKERKLEGEEAVFTVSVPKGFVGKTRLQVIIPEGLMDSYQLTFDTVRGPEILSLTPDQGDKGTIVVIKRDTQANEVSFKLPLPDSKVESERIGSRVLWNGKDINELFNGYKKTAAGTVEYQKSDTFYGFKQADKNSPAEFVNLPGKYVYVVDPDTIYLKIPEDANLKEGPYKIQIKNPDGSESANGAIFTVVDTIDKTIIDKIEPNTDDKDGGIVTKISAGKDAAGKQTNFKGQVDVYFGSQKADVVAYDLEYLNVYVKVPPLVDFKFPATLQDTVEAYIVPVTVQNKVNKSSDTKLDGFKYLNPAYKMEITQVYNEKYSAKPEAKNANTGVEGENLIIRGNNFRLQWDDAKQKYILPKVMFGYELAEEPIGYGPKNVDKEGKPVLDEKGRAELEWIKVKIPPRPFNVAEDGSVTLLVQNPDGAKATKEKGFIYVMAKPKINQPASILKASRFFDTIVVAVRDVNPTGLIAAFGEKIYEKELSASPIEVETTDEVERIVIRYTPSAQENLEIFYRAKDGSLIAMTDTEGTNGGRFRLDKVGDKKIIGINWANIAYHSTEITKNPDLVSKLNKEYVQVSIVNKADNINALVVRRGLGKITDASVDPVSKEYKLTIETPYWSKAEKTTISIINADGSSDTAPFEFHGGLNAPEITDIENSKSRNIKINDKYVDAKIYTTDYTEPDIITVIGKNFKDVELVKIGDFEVKVVNISPDYTKMKLEVPAGKEELVGVPLPITVVTKEGSAYSDKSVPPVYFMYIKAGSKPVITKITPAKGPQTGGTKITIYGKNFNEKDEFGTTGKIEITIAGKTITADKLNKNEQGEIISIEAVTPAVDMIEPNSKLQVKNADGGKSAPADFRYISQPQIEKVEGEVAFNSQESPDGKKVTIKLIGKNFYDPEYVRIGGKLLKINKNKDDEENALMLGIKSDRSNQYVDFEKDEAGNVKGKQLEIDTAKSVKGENGLVDAFEVNIPVITPEEMDSIISETIVVVDKDGGVSPEKPVKIKTPRPEAPAVIATPGYNNTINVDWHLKKDDLNKADRFEIYVKEKGAKNDYLNVGVLPKNQNGSLDYHFVIKDTKPDTEYQIKVRVMNAYGEAKDFGYANIKTLALKDDYKQKEKLNELNRAKDKLRQHGSGKVVGNRLVYTVGSLDQNIALAGYKNAKTKEVRIPVSQIRLSPNSSITLNDTNMSLTVPFSAFNIAQIQQTSDDTVVLITIDNENAKMDEKITKLAASIGYKRAGKAHNIDFKLAEPKKTTPIAFSLEPLTLSMIPSSQGTGLTLAKYNPGSNKLITGISDKISDGGYYVLLKKK